MSGSYQLKNEFLQLLVCPSCKVKVESHEKHLQCTKCQRKFLIHEKGIPIMLVEGSDQERTEE